MSKTSTLRSAVIAFALGTSALSALPAQAADGPARRAATAARRPNVIVILADDLGYGDTSVYGSKVIRTPNIDQLAAEGTRFTNGYVSHPVCAPSRAALLTGRYQERFGYEFNPVGREERGGVDIHESMTGQFMKAGGYATGMVGKWHLGDPAGYHPTDRGFDEFFGITAGGSVYITQPKPTDHFFTVPGSEAAERTTNEPDPRLATMSPAERLRFIRAGSPVQRGKQVVDEPTYLTEAFTREAVSFIDRHKAQPFYLYLAYNAPHTPLQTTGEYWDRYPEVKDTATRTYAAMVSALDDGVGAVMRKLKDSGIDRDTLVVFLSDNGCASYIRGACSNAPLSGFKAQYLEGGVRVPFIVRWTGKLPAGRVDDRTVSSLDITPTAAALAGRPAPRGRPWDGVDLLPYLDGRNPGVPNPTLMWRAGVNYAIREGDWKMLVVNKAPPGADTTAVPPIPPDGVQAEIGPLGQHTMLYQLPDDIGERTNVAAAQPGVVSRLTTKLAAWNKGLATPLWTSKRWAYFRWDGVRLQLFN